MGWPRWTRERLIDAIIRVALAKQVPVPELQKKQFILTLRAEGTPIGHVSIAECGGWLDLRRAAAAPPDTRWRDEDTDRMVNVSPELSVEGEIPIPELIEQRVLAARHKHARAAKHHQTLELPPRPLGLMIWGDPHLDNEGCNWAQLLEHLRLVQDQTNVWNVCVGDMLDNWIGRLQRLYADASIRATDGWRLNVWFLESLQWMAVVGGNHDAWAGGPGTDPLGWISEAARVECYAPDEIRLTLRWRGRGDLEPAELLIRHDVRGRSWYHPTHGPHKEAMLDGRVHLVAAGHIHQWGALQTEQRHGRVTTALRVRGYKRDDSYARQLGFAEQEHGASCLVVIEPELSGPGRLTLWWDIARGVEYLRSIS